jgi:hypothetical protein
MQILMGNLIANISLKCPTDPPCENLAYIELDVYSTEGSKAQETQSWLPLG